MKRFIGGLIVGLCLGALPVAAQWGGLRDRALLQQIADSVSGINTELHVANAAKKAVLIQCAPGVDLGNGLFGVPNSGVVNPVVKK